MGNGDGLNFFLTTSQANMLRLNQSRVKASQIPHRRSGQKGQPGRRQTALISEASLAQTFITGQMAVMVVIGFKEINIHHNQRKRDSDCVLRGAIQAQVNHQISAG